VPSRERLVRSHPSPDCSGRRLRRALDVPILVRRVTATWLVLGAAGGLASGCGGSHSAIAQGATLSASAQITKAQATAYAYAVNLRAADVPEMSIGSPEGTAPAPMRSAFEFARCYSGVSPARLVLNVHSPEFSIGHGAQSELEESEVEVWPTPDLAAHNFAANHGSRERACFVRFQEADNRNRNRRRSGQLLYGPLTVSALPAPLPGVDRSFGLRIVQSLLRGGQIRLHIYHDVFGFLSGPAEIELTATGFSRPVPSATEERLLLLLYSRAEAHML
jgi:hypothetical protein